jgi:hypothetical protein
LCQDPSTACGESKYEFQLDGNSIKYLLNPISNASNTKIFASIQYQAKINGRINVNPQNGIGPQWDSLGNLTFQDTLYTIKTKVFTTKVFPLECLPKVISKINALPISGTGSNQLNFVDGVDSIFTANIVLYVYYEFNPDEYNVVHHSTQMLKFPCNFNIVTNKLTTNPDFATLNNIPTNGHLTNFDFTSVALSGTTNIYSYGTITIDGHLQNTSGIPFHIIAQNAIDLEPGAEVDPTIILEIAPSPPICDGLSPIAQASIECTNSSEYQANHSNAKTDETSYGNKQDDSYFNLRLFPNPTAGKCTIVFDLPESKNATITLTDLMGRTVKTIDNSWHDKGSTTVQFDTESFASGIYFVRFFDGEHTVVKRLGIQHNY